MNYSQTTQDLIDRMCRNVERKDFELDKKNAEECILKTYDLFKLKRPSKIVWFNDIFGKFDDIARSAWSAGSAGSALDYDFDWFIIEHEYCVNRKDNPGKEPNENDKVYLEYAELLMKAKEYGLGYRVEQEDILYLVSTPLVLINSRNQFHSAEKPAIRWKKGKEFYYLNGVNFSQDLWEKTVNRKLSFAEVSQIKDIDQRTQAMAYCPPREFLEKQGKLLNKSERGNELWLVPQSAKLFRIDAYFLLYKDISTSREYLSGIDPEVGKKGNADEAMAWKFSIGLQDYNLLKMES